MAASNSDYQCPSCLQPCSRQDALNRHLRRFHYDQPQLIRDYATGLQWSCPHCPACYSDRFALYDHLSFDHGGRKEEYFLDPWTGRREVREMDRYPEADDLEKEDVESVIEVLDRLTFSEGVTLVGRRGPKMQGNDVSLTLECHVDGCPYCVHIQARNTTGGNAEANAHRHALVRQLHAGKYAHHLLNAQRFDLRIQRGHTCGHIGAPEVRSNPSLRITKATVEYLYDVGCKSTSYIARLVRGDLTSRKNREYLPQGMRDFRLTPNDIRNWVYYFNKSEDTLVFDEDMVESMYYDYHEQTSHNPFFLLYKPACRTTGDPFGVVPNMPRAYWTEVKSEAVILVLATNQQMEQVKQSIDATIYVDSSFKRTKYPLHLLNMSILKHGRRMQVVASALISQENFANVRVSLSTFRQIWEKKFEEDIGTYLTFYMTDDSQILRQSLESVFPELHHLLCTVHLLDALVARCKRTHKVPEQTLTALADNFHKLVYHDVTQDRRRLIEYTMISLTEHHEGGEEDICGLWYRGYPTDYILTVLRQSQKPFTYWLINSFLKPNRRQKWVRSLKRSLLPPDFTEELPTSNNVSESSFARHAKAWAHDHLNGIIPDVSTFIRHIETLEDDQFASAVLTERRKEQRMASFVRQLDRRSNTGPLQDSDPVDGGNSERTAVVAETRTHTLTVGESTSFSTRSHRVDEENSERTTVGSPTTTHILNWREDASCGPRSTGTTLAPTVYQSLAATTCDDVGTGTTANSTSEESVLQPEGNYTAFETSDDILEMGPSVVRVPELRREVSTCHMSREDIRSLEDGSSLYVSVVRHILCILDYQRYTSETDAFMLDPDTLTSLRTVGWGSEWVGALARVSRVIGVAYVYGSHFLTIEWVSDLQEVYIYDSAEDMTAEIQDEIFRLSQLVASICEANKDEPAYSEWSIRRISAPKQRNAVDCGIFAIMFAYVALHRKDMPPASTIEGMRHRFMEYFFNSLFPQNLTQNAISNFFFPNRYTMPHNMSNALPVPLFDEGTNRSPDVASPDRESHDPPHLQLLRSSQWRHTLRRQFETCRQRLYNLAPRTEPESLDVEDKSPLQLFQRLFATIETTPSEFPQDVKDQFQEELRRIRDLNNRAGPYFRRAKGIQGFENPNSASRRTQMSNQHRETNQFTDHYRILTAPGLGAATDNETGNSSSSRERDPNESLRTENPSSTGAARVQSPLGQNRWETSILSGSRGRRRNKRRRSS